MSNNTEEQFYEWLESCPVEWRVSNDDGEFVEVFFDIREDTD